MSTAHKLTMISHTKIKVSKSSRWTVCTSAGRTANTGTRHQVDQLTCFAVDSMFVEVFEDNSLDKWGCYEGREHKHEAHPQDVNVVQILVHLQCIFLVRYRKLIWFISWECTAEFIEILRWLRPISHLYVTDICE